MPKAQRVRLTFEHRWQGAPAALEMLDEAFSVILALRCNQTILFLHVWEDVRRALISPPVCSMHGRPACQTEAAPDLVAIM